MTTPCASRAPSLTRVIFPGEGMKRIVDARTRSLERAWNLPDPPMSTSTFTRFEIPRLLVRSRYGPTPRARWTLRTWRAAQPAAGFLVIRNCGQQKNRQNGLTIGGGGELIHTVGGLCMSVYAPVRLDLGVLVTCSCSNYEIQPVVFYPICVRREKAIFFPKPTLWPVVLVAISTSADGQGAAWHCRKRKHQKMRQLALLNLGSCRVLSTDKITSVVGILCNVTSSRTWCLWLWDMGGLSVF